MKSIVILPTYNERENITRIIEEIHEYAPDTDILVVDDQSPDGTGDMADQIARSADYVYVMHRPGPRGRGYAGVDGFQYAIDHGYDAIVEMDADFSHDPRYLPAILRRIETCDVVIGSRYRRGGMEQGRSIARQYITKLARIYLRLILGVSRIADPTSGYRCFTRKTLLSVNVSTLRSSGPSIVTEVLFRCRKRHISEVPIVFSDRERGTSKFGTHALWDSVCIPFMLRMKQLLTP